MAKNHATGARADVTATGLALLVVAVGTTGVFVTVLWVRIGLIVIGLVLLTLCGVLMGRSIRHHRG